MHEHESGSLWHEYLSIQFDLAHMLAELGFTLVFDLIIIFLLWGKVLKPWLAKSVHKEFDKDHGINHKYQEPTVPKYITDREFRSGENLRQAVYQPPPYSTGAVVDPKDIPPARRAERKRQGIPPY